MENLKYTSQRVSDFATRFCTLLDEKKMNSTEAAKHFGVSKQPISAWRCGDRTPSVMTMQNIATYFNVNPTWLFGYDVPEYPWEEMQCPNQEVEDAMNLLFRYYGLDDGSQAFLRSFFNLPKAKRDAIGDFFRCAAMEYQAGLRRNVPTGETKPES